MSEKTKYFRIKLLEWNRLENRRLMPWKGERDPYKIWLSEIILQQTRVEQGWDYYTRFIEAFPDILHLSRAPEKKLFKLWEGLGYYNRCKNLLITAKYIAGELNGKFPDNYADILSLKGVGPYTAAAIASFAYDQPYAVVDGNVFRVLARYFGISEAIDSTVGRKQFTRLADELLDPADPGRYNQALMDFGAGVCKPKQPACTTCPLNKRCTGYRNNSVTELPVKAKTLTRKTRWFYYIIAEHEGKIYIRKRTDSDIWENLYEFILIEKKKPLSIKKLLNGPEISSLFGKAILSIESVSAMHSQQLTHQIIRGRFIRLKSAGGLLEKGFKMVNAKQLARLPFPKFINSYLGQPSE